MKTIASLLVVTLVLASPVLADIPSTTRPEQAALNTSITLPVMISGHPSGSVNVDKGTLVTIKDVSKDRVQIDFQGSTAWVKRSNTDFDKRLATFKKTKHTAQAEVKQAQVAENTAAKKQDQKGAADFQKQQSDHSNPLNKGAYDQQRSVVDYYDALGRRYHIGVYGQRIYQ